MSDDLLEVLKTSHRGKGLAATRRIPEYSLIHREPATLGALEEEHLSTMCSYCFTFNPKFPPKKCASCKTVSYCSEKCQRKDWPIHKHECVFIDKWGQPGLSMMRLLVRCLIRAKQEPLFLESLNGLVSNEIPSDQRRLFIVTEVIMTTHMPFAIPENIDSDEVIRIGCILKSNTLSALTDVGTPKAIMFCPRAALFNHSCDPNAEFFFDGRVLRVASLKTIAEGEEISVSYVNRLAPKTDRREILRDRYDSDCNCLECQREEEGQTDMALLDRNVPLTKRLDILNGYLMQRKQKLFTYYMRLYLFECHVKFKTGQLYEAQQILAMLLELPDYELKVDLPDMAARRDLYLIGMLCEQALNGVDKVTPVSLMMQKGRDQIDELLKEPRK